MAQGDWGVGETNEKVWHARERSQKIPFSKWDTFCQNITSLQLAAIQQFLDFSNFQDRAI